VNPASHYILSIATVTLVTCPLSACFDREPSGEDYFRGITLDCMPDVVVPIIGVLLVICGVAARWLLNERRENRYRQKMRALVPSLVVGQEVYMFSGCYVNKGKVIKVTPEGVDVQTGMMQNDGTWNAHELLHFDNNGRSYVTELPPSYRSTAHPMGPRGWDGNGTYECGPWELDDMPFGEREALNKKKAQDYRDKMLPFVTWWKSATHEQRLVVVKKWYDNLLPYIRAEKKPAQNVASTPDISSDGFLMGVLEPYWKTSRTPSE
jgi:preprotein translocase subunit YajC